MEVYQTVKLKMVLHLSATVTAPGVTGLLPTCELAMCALLHYVN